MRNSQKRKLNCEKLTKDMKDIGEPLRERVLNVFVYFEQFITA